MDIVSLREGIDLVYTTISTLKKMKEFIPSGDKKQDFEKKLEEAEKKMKIAEANIAKEFDFKLCHRHFPPGILLEISEYKSKCNTCGNVVEY